MRRCLAGLLAHARGDHLFPRALRQQLQALRRRHLRADQGGLVDATTAPPASGWSARARASVRVECRIGGADLNPYLAYAALIAAGIDGIERGLELEPEFRGDAYRRRRAAGDPEDAARRHRGAATARTMLRAAFGDEVVDHYLHAARWEQAETDRG